MDTKRIHILVVDDLPDMAESTAELLALWGYDATACTSGIAALACARVRRPAAVLLDLVMPRMDGFEFARAFRALKMTRSAQGAFVSLPGGTGELVDALAAALAPTTVTTLARVTEIRRAGDYSIEWAGGSVRSRALVLCVPAYAAAGLLRAFDTGLAGACDSIPYASTATVAFGYRADQVRHPMRGTGFVVPRTERRALLAGTWVTSKWPGRAPEGHVLMRAFLGGGRDPHRLERNDDAALVLTAEQELVELLEISGPPLFSRLTRWARQSPQFAVGHQARVTAIEQRLKALPGLFLAGSGFRAIGIPDCIADGRATAATVAGFLKRSTAA